MPSNGFSVVPDDLRKAADGLSDQLDVAGDMISTAQSAALPQDSWGLLGNAVGLYAAYSDLVSAANDHLVKVQSYLQWAQSNLSGTAAAYEQADRTVAASLPKSGASA